MPQKANSHPEARLDRWVAPILSIAQMVSWGAMFYAFAIVLEPMSAELGASRTRLSATFSLGLLLLGLSAWPVGMLIDRGYTRVVMTFGSVLACVGLLLHAQASSVAQLFVAWAVIGCAMACTLYEPAFAAMVRAYPNSYRSRITVLTLLGGLASTVFWPLTAALTAQFGWRAALTCLGLMQLLICAPIHWFVLPEAHASLHSANQGERASAWALARTRLFMNLTISFATHLLVMSAVAALLVTMFDKLGLSHQTTLIILACMGPTQVAGRLFLLFTERGRHASVANLAVIWMPTLAIALLLLLSVLDARAWTWLAVLAVLVYGAGNGMLTIIKGTAVAEMVGPQRVATLNGIAAIPSAFARAAGPFVIAAIWEGSGSISLALLALLAVAGVSSLSFVVATRLHLKRLHLENSTPAAVRAP